MQQLVSEAQEGARRPSGHTTRILTDRASHLVSSCRCRTPGRTATSRRRREREMTCERERDRAARARARAGVARRTGEAGGALGGLTMTTQLGCAHRRADGAAGGGGGVGCDGGGGGRDGGDGCGGGVGWCGDGGFGGGGGCAGDGRYDGRTGASTKQDKVCSCSGLLRTVRAAHAGCRGEHRC